jgi:membrane associated rhomboid family serine protease
MENFKYQAFNNKVVAGTKNWVANAPLFTIALLAVCLLLFILSFPFNLQMIFGNMPDSTLGKLQVYRLFTFPFVNPSILGIVLIAIFYFPVLTEQEKSWGTIKTALYFLVKNLEIGLVYCIIAGVFSNIYDKIGTNPSFSLWPVFLSFLTQESLKNPEQMQNILWIPGLYVKNKFCPFIFGLIFLLLASSTWFPLDAIVAIALGFAASYTDPYYISYLSDTKITEIEQAARLQTIKAHPRFIVGQQHLGTNLINNDSIPDAHYTPALYEPSSQQMNNNNQLNLDVKSQFTPIGSGQPVNYTATNYPSGLLHDMEEDLEKK